MSLWFHFKRRCDEINHIPSWAIFISRNCLLYTCQELKDFSCIIKAHLTATLIYVRTAGESILSNFSPSLICATIREF